MWIAVLVTLLIFSVVLGKTAEDDEIKALPGVQFNVTFKHYSGFLQTSDTHHLHYWFVESQGDPSVDPLIFWFNGGPGCSSLQGLLNEMGPYVINPDGTTLRKNKNSWNKMANIVYLESPAGVGYSFSTDVNITTSDDQTADEKYLAIKTWFVRFPKFRSNPAFIMGESYAGVYVPTLTARIIDGQQEFNINLKGMAIGNGLMHNDMNTDTLVRFAYGHGLVDEQIWKKLDKNCCKGCIDNCNLAKLTGKCDEMIEDIIDFAWIGGLNPYDLYRDCEATPDDKHNRIDPIMRGVFPRMERRMTMRMKTMKQPSQSNETIPMGVSCINVSDAVAYMNNADVRTALHIPLHVGNWEMCSDIDYEKQYADMSPFIKKIVQAKVPVLLFYGDTDIACNFLMGEKFSAQLGLERKQGKTPWKFDGQIGGFKTVYEGITFLTVRGAGHMAAQWKAPEMYYVIQRFLFDEPI